MNRFFALFCTIFLSTLSVQALADEILTAERFLALVGERYQMIEDYSAEITIRSGRSIMTAKALFKDPKLLRLDFSQPEGQIIVFNGETLTVYLPEYRAVLSQTVSTDSTSTGASLASASGLAILRRNYAPSYKVSPEPLPLNEEEGEGIDTGPMVVKLVLSRRSFSEGFREIRLSVDPETLLILRMEGTTIANEIIRFDFSGFVINEGIGDALFTYESQPSANFYDNFLFRDSD